MIQNFPWSTASVLWGICLANLDLASTPIWPGGSITGNIIKQMNARSAIVRINFIIKIIGFLQSYIVSLIGNRVFRERDGMSLKERIMVDLGCLLIGEISGIDWGKIFGIGDGCVSYGLHFWLKWLKL